VNNFKTRMHRLKLFLIAIVLAFATAPAPLHSARKLGLLGVPLPRGATLVSKMPQTAERDAMETYGTTATSAEIMAFFKAELPKSGWTRWRGDIRPDWAAFKKGNRLIAIATNEKNKTFMIMGGVR